MCDAATWQHAVKQAAVEHHKAVLFRRHQPSFVRDAPNSLVGDEGWASALRRHKRDGRRQGMQQQLCVRRLHEVKMQLVAVAVRPAVRPPLRVTRTLGCGNCSTRARPHAVQNLPDAIGSACTKVVAEREKPSSRAAKGMNGLRWARLQLQHLP